MNPEDNQYEQLHALNELLKDHNQFQADVIKHLRTTIVIIVICFTVIICTMICGFFYYKSQFETTSTISKTETTSTELKTEGENANINSVVGGNMYNDDAVHNQN